LLFEDFAADIAAVQRIENVEAILAHVCRITGMRFAAVARVTDSRWIACQLDDRVEFGLEPGDELELSTTICDEIRVSGQGVFIDHVGNHPEWRTHHTPILYGFESYVSVPILLDDGSFFGTLCAIDPSPRRESLEHVYGVIEGMAREIGESLSRPLPGAPPAASI
jgi:GAF domain-containing protein